MKLALNWQKPLALRASQNGYVYEVDLEDIPQEPGIYMFYRQHGNTRSVLYVGKAERLQSRIKQQLNVVKLMLSIKGAAVGGRYLVFGLFESKPGQRYRKCLPLIERGLIRHFLSEGHDLFNKQGTKMSYHTITSSRSSLKKLIPREVFFE